MCQSRIKRWESVRQLVHFPLISSKPSQALGPNYLPGHHLKWMPLHQLNDSVKGSRKRWGNLYRMRVSALVAAWLYWSTVCWKLSKFWRQKKKEDEIKLGLMSWLKVTQRVGASHRGIRHHQNVQRSLCSPQRSYIWLDSHTYSLTVITILNQ